jgi:cell division protein FtsZ
MIEYKLETLTPPVDAAPAVSIIGIGGAGSNVLDHIALEGMNGVELISMNCDARSLTSSMAQRKVQLGKTLTQGLGCGGDPDLGQEAAVSSLADIRDAISGRRMIFLCVGLGGGTSSGAAPIVARLARESGAFVIVFATMPFVFEGKRRLAQAQASLEQVRQHAHALVCFENDKMGELVLPKKGVTEAFEIANKIICQSVRAVTTVATQPGLIRIGLDDLVTALKNADSRCLFGFGQAKGEARATEALANALKSPLLDRGQLLEKARNVLVHICGGQSLTLFEIETLMRELHKHVSEEAQILFGAACDQKLGESVSVTIISSLGRAKAASPFTAVEQPPAPVPPSSPVQTTPPSPPLQSRPVPILSVQPRQTPSHSANFLAPGENTATAATSGVPVMQLTAQLLQPKPVKAVKSAPLTPPSELDLFTAPASESPPIQDEVPAVSVAGVIEEVNPIAETIIEEVTPVIPEAETEVTLEEPVLEPVAAVIEVPEPEEEILAEIEEEEPVLEEMPMAPAPEEAEWEEEVIEPQTAVEAEVEEEEPVFVAEEEEITVEAEEEQPVVMAEEEAEITAEEEEEIVPHPAFAAGLESSRQTAPMRPIEIPPPAAKPAARKFDLREILQRQRQTRLGQRHSAAAQHQQPTPPAPRPEPVTARQETPVRPLRVPGTPDPARVQPIRPIAPAQTAVAGRHASPFLPTRAPSTPITAPAAAVAVAAGHGEHQQTFDEHLAPVERMGRFAKAEPTVEEGEDLDIPTFLRKKR